MAKFPKWSVRVYSTNSDGIITSVSYTEITDVTNIEIMTGNEQVKDTFSFEIPFYETNDTTFGKAWRNQVALNTFGDRIIRLNDIVTIFAGYGPNANFPDTCLLMVGVVKKLTITDADKKMRIKIEGANRTEELLRGMIPYSTIGRGVQTAQVPDIIIDIIRRLNAQNVNHKVYASKTSQTITVTGTAGQIQATKRDGTAFGGVSYNVTWKPLFLQLEQLSSPDYTGDDDAGHYLFYIKPIPVLPAYQLQAPDGTKPGPFADVLVWSNPSVTTAGIGSVIEGQGITNVSINYDVRNVINAMIVNAGKDLNDHGILRVAYDLDSMGKFGTRWAYYTKSQKKFSQLHAKEVSLGQLSGSTFNTQTHFPLTYPWVMHYTGTPSASNDNTFNNLLRTQAALEAVDEAQSVISKLKNATYDCLFDMDIGSNTFTLGGLYYFQFPSIGWEGTTDNPGRVLRIRDQTHIINDKGWQSRITALEDETVITAQFK